MRLESLDQTLQPTQLLPSPEIYWDPLAAGMEHFQPSYSSNTRGDIFNGGFSHSTECFPCGAQFYERPFAPFQPAHFSISQVDSLALGLQPFCEC